MITVLFLSGITAVIIVRTLSRDIARYNEVDEVNQFVPPSAADRGRRTPWSRPVGSWFMVMSCARPPTPSGWCSHQHPDFANRARLVTLVGTGVQLISMIVVTLVVACLGMLSPGTQPPYALPF